jgi:hypothetical protein
MTALSVTAQTVVLDDFADSQAQLQDPGSSASTQAQSVGMIAGGERDVVVTRISGSGTVTGEVTGGNLAAAFPTTPNDTSGTIEVTWDGADGDPDTLDPVGLGGLDLTAGEAGGIRFEVASVTDGIELTLEIYQSSTLRSGASRVLAASMTPVDVFIDFSELIASGSAGPADLTQVGAVVMTIHGVAGDLTLADVRAFGASPTATKSALTTGGAPLAGSITPGSSFKYRVVVDADSGAETANLALDDSLDPALTLTPGSVTTTPVARPDQYTAFGNVVRVVAAVDGLLANDSDPDDGMSPQPLTVVAAMAQPTARGGVVDLLADGGFTYQPPAGFRGVDEFGYVVMDNEGQMAPGSATIALGGAVWFVDNTACSPFPCGAGTQAQPFGSLAQAETSSLAGDVIRLREGSGTTAGYDQGIALKDRQQLIGGGVDLVLGGQLVESADPGPPQLVSGGSGISVALDNVIRGLDVGDTGGSGLFASAAFGSLTVSDMRIVGTGRAINFNGAGTLDATFDELASSGGVNGVIAGGVGGSLVVTGSTTISGTTSGSAIWIQGTPAGSVFDFGVTTISGAGANGIELLGSDPGAIFRFTDLSVTVPSGAGMIALNSGTIDLHGTPATISAIGGRAIRLEGTRGETNGAPGWTFGSLSSTASPDEGVRLAGLLDPFTVTTSTTVTDADSTGILVQNSPGQALAFGATSVLDTSVGSGANGNGVDVATGNAGASFTFAALDITADGGFGLRANGAASLTITGADNDLNVTGGVAVSFESVASVAATFDQIVVNNGAGQGIHLASLGGSTSFGSLQVTSATGAGLFADAAGTVTVMTGSIATTNSQAVDINSTTTAITLTSMTSTGSPGVGVDLTNLPAMSAFSGGTTTVTNPSSFGINLESIASGSAISFGQTGIVNRSTTGIRLTSVGGTVGFGATTIANPGAVGGNGVDIRGSSAAVTFASATISGSRVTNAETFVTTDRIELTDDANDDGDAIFMRNNTGSLAVNGGTLSDSADDGLDIRGSSAVALSNVTITQMQQFAIQGWSVNGLSLTGCSINRIGDDVANPLGLPDDAMWFGDLAGTVLLQGSTVDMNLNRNGTQQFVASAFPPGAMNSAVFALNRNVSTQITVRNTAFKNISNDGLQLIHKGSGGHSLTVLVEGTVPGPSSQCLFQNWNGRAVSVDHETMASNPVDVTVQGCRLENGGLGLRVGASGPMTFRFDNNQLTNLALASNIDDAFRVRVFPGGNVTAGRIVNNTITTADSFVSFIGQGGAATLKIDGNTFTSNNLGSIGLSTQDGGSAQIEFTNNHVLNVDRTSEGTGGGIVQASGGPAAASMCIGMSGNTFTGNAPSYGDGFLFWDKGPGTLQLEGFAGGNEAAAAAALNASNTGTPAPFVADFDIYAGTLDAGPMGGCTHLP